MFKTFQVFITLLIMGCSSTALSSENSLPTLNALNNETSISGLSSGAFMAAQFHVAYSKDLVGAGIVAGGPWNCAGTNPLVPPLSTAVSTCMDPCKNNWFYQWFGCPSMLLPNSDFLADLAKSNAELGEIDDTNNLKDDKIYIFSGKNDHTVVTDVVDTTTEFYQNLGVDQNAILYNDQTQAGHAFITENPKDTPCDETQSPYINDCDIPQAQKILSHIYGDLNPASSQLSGELMSFKQTDFFESELTSMNDTAYVYVPENCKAQQCKVHVALHGCQQGVSVLGTTYIEQTGYMEVADSNNIIVLYPQVKKSSLVPFNPKGCWDFWGYSNNSLPPYNYYQKDAPQMMAIKKMIDQLTGQTTQVSQQL